jgi:hypothetical protein
VPIDRSGQPPVDNPGRCDCGLPLHYETDGIKAQVDSIVLVHGWWQPITVMTGMADGDMTTWWVPRHYIALHLFHDRSKWASLPALASRYGWPRKDGPVNPAMVTPDLKR